MWCVAYADVKQNGMWWLLSLITRWLLTWKRQEIQRGSQKCQGIRETQEKV